MDLRKEMQIDRQIDRWMDRQIDLKIKGQKYRQIGRQKIYYCMFFRKCPEDG